MMLFVRRTAGNPFRMGREDISLDISGFVVPKGTPWKQDMNDIIGRLVKN